MLRLTVALLALSLSAATFAAESAEAETLGQKASGMASKAAKAVKRGLEKGEAAVEKSAEKTADAVKSGAEKTGAAVKKGADKTGAFVKKIAKKAKAAVTRGSGAK